MIRRLPRGRRSWVGIAALLVVLSLALVSVASGARSSRPQTIVLDMAAPLTGGADATGIATCNGEKLAAADINAHGGIRRGPLKGARFKIQCVDTKLSAALVGSIASKYVSDSSIWAMTGFYTSGNALAAAIVAERAGLVVIGGSVSADFLTTQVHNVYTLDTTLEPPGGAALDFCHAYYHTNKVAALVPNYSYEPFYLQGAKTAAAKENVSIVTNDTWPDGQTTDWSPYLHKLDRAGAGCVLLGAYPPEQCEITAQARQLGLTQPMIDITESWTSSSCQKEAGRYYPGMIFGSVLPAYSKKGSLTARVAAKYRARYHQLMSYYAGNGYNVVLSVEYAIEAGAKSRTDLLADLAKAKGPGVGGPISFKGKRIGFRYITFNEVNLKNQLQPVGEYGIYQNGTWKRFFVKSCSARKSCQKNLGAGR